MKKLHLLLILSIGLFSCTQEEDLPEVDNIQTTPHEILTRSADGKYRVLGFGYDVTGENLDRKSIRYPVIDIKKIEKEAPSSLIYNTETNGRNFYYYGYSAEDYVKEVAKKTGYSVSINDPNKDAKEGSKEKASAFGGNISNNREFDSKYSYSSKYSFASADIMKSVATMEIAEIHIENLLKFVSDKFLADLQTSTPAQIVEHYGTHVITDITIGGHLQIMYRSVITYETDYTRKKNIVKAGLNITLKKIGLGASADKEVETKETTTRKNIQQSLYVKYKAGEGIGGTYNLETGVPTINQGTWEQSVNTTNAGLVEINWNRTYPIYEFVKDPQKKAQIKQAVKDYIASKKLEVMQLTPLYQYYSEKNGHYYDTRAVVESEKGKKDGIVCYVYSNKDGKSKPINTTPLFQYYSDQHKHYYDTNPNVLEIDKGLGKKDGIVCYVYGNQDRNLVPIEAIPLYQYSKMLKGGSRFYYDTRPIVEAEKGKKDGIVCYVFPK